MLLLFYNFLLPDTVQDPLWSIVAPYVVMYSALQMLKQGLERVKYGDEPSN